MATKEVKAVGNARRKFVKPENVDDDIIKEVGGAKTLNDMPESMIAGNLKIRPPKVMSPKKALNQYLNEEQRMKLEKKKPRKKRMEAAPTDKVPTDAKPNQKKEKAAAAAIAAAMAANKEKEDAKEAEANAAKLKNETIEDIPVPVFKVDDMSEEEDDGAMDINSRIKRTEKEVALKKEAYYKEQDQLEARKNALRKPYNPKEFMLKQPVMLPCPYGESWALDLFALPHNAIKRELLDMYRIVESMGKRMADLRRNEIDLFFHWWEAFENLVITYFEVEEEIVYKVLATKIDLRNTKLSRPTRRLEKGRILRILREVNECEEKFVYLPAPEVLHRLVILVDRFSPRLLEYFTNKEMTLPPLLLDRSNQYEKTEIEKASLEIYMESEFATEVVVLLTRWLNDAQLKHWKKQNLKRGQQISYAQWYSNVEKDHFSVVTEFQKSLANHKSAMAARQAAKAKEEQHKLEVKALHENRGKLDDGSRVLKVRGGADQNQILPPGAKMPSALGSPPSGPIKVPKGPVPTLADAQAAERAAEKAERKAMSPRKMSSLKNSKKGFEGSSASGGLSVPVNPKKAISQIKKPEKK